MDSPATNTRLRASKLAASNSAASQAPAPAKRTVREVMARNPPFLPTHAELAVFAIFPVLLVFGTLFAVLSPQTRTAPYDPITQAHIQDASVAPSYFARKSNLFNILFVKRGWGWTTGSFLLFLFTHPHLAYPASAASRRKLQAGTRWAIVTAWWFLVTQWCFGPALIDRGFRWTGGQCDEVAAMMEGQEDVFESSAREIFTAVACKAAGGKWRGGHDISGHVFLLVLASGFLLQEVGWVLLRWGSEGTKKDERTVVMKDGALKGASVEAGDEWEAGVDRSAIGVGAKVAGGVVALSCWMLLMTAIYFHTWFEKLTGLLTAFIGLYGVYILPRFVPALRQTVGIPGI